MLPIDFVLWPMKLTALYTVTVGFVLIGLGLGHATPTFPLYEQPTKSDLLTFSEMKGAHEESISSTGVVSHTQTYRSKPLPLGEGEVVFTDPKRTPLIMPTGNIALTRFHAFVVDETGRSVPLNEVYNHHWLVFNGRGNAGVCGGYLSYVFGVGAESRDSPVEFPENYGLVLNGSEEWGANIHLLRTVNTMNVKNCIECVYTPEKGCAKEQSGKFACCGDGSYCQLTKDGNRSETKTYFLQYSVTWVDVYANLIPLEIMVLDASGCEIEYNIEASNTAPVHTTTFSWTSKHTGEIVYGTGHQHIGALNISLFLDGQCVCTNVPKYGNGTTAGNEKGYVVQIDTCDFENNSVLVRAGQTVSVTSLYDVSPNDQRGLPHGGGAHGGVMSLFYLGVAMKHD